MGLTKPIKLSKVTSSSNFSLEIEELVTKHNITYMDAIILFCEKNNVEIESIASLVKNNSKVKFKLQEEAESLNFLPKTAKLPI